MQRADTRLYIYVCRFVQITGLEKYSKYFSESNQHMNFDLHLG